MKSVITTLYKVMCLDAIITGAGKVIDYFTVVCSVPWRAFLKRPENFSGPKTFRGCFQARFSGSGKRFSKRPIFSRDFR